MYSYDKVEIKEQLTTEMVFDIVFEFGGDPRYNETGFVSATICHNAAGEGSHKLYYYENTQLFRCYTGCDDTFDIFELITKVKHIAGIQQWELNDSVVWVAHRFGWGPSYYNDKETPLESWLVLDKYDKIKVKIEEAKTVELKEYDSSVLTHLLYPLIGDWKDEGITSEVQKHNLIGYYPSSEQITIPHFDKDGRFIGLRGRALGKDEAELYGKYRPLMVGKQMYNHALGLNLYNLNNSKDNIKTARKAIIFEGEKSCLLYQSYFGIENDISVACCGSSISSFQIKLLMDLGAEEIIVAFDRQFKERGDNEFKKLVKNLKNLDARYGTCVRMSFMFDKWDKLPYKASPIDCGKETFLYLYKNRVSLE